MTVRVDVALTPAELPARVPSSTLVVVIDVVRATTVIATALAAGCDGVRPAAGIDEAVEWARESDALLVGERGGLPPQGFDLGNSPRDFTPARVGARRVVLTTTNGTAAVRRCLGAAAIFAGAFVNAEATCRALARVFGDAPDPGDEDRSAGAREAHARRAGSGGPGASLESELLGVTAGVDEILLVCAGSGGELCADDVAAAGCLAGSLALLLGAEPSDGARVAAALFDTWRHDLPGLLARSLSGRKLAAVGLGDDLVGCAQVDSVPVAAVLDGSGVFRKLSS